MSIKRGIWGRELLDFIVAVCKGFAIGIAMWNCFRKGFGGE